MQPCHLYVVVVLRIVPQMNVAQRAAAQMAEAYMTVA